MSVRVAKLTQIHTCLRKGNINKWFDEALLKEESDAEVIDCDMAEPQAEQPPPTTATTATNPLTGEYAPPPPPPLSFCFSYTVYVNILERKYYGTLVGWRSRFFSFHNIYRAFCDSGTWTR